MVQCFSPDCNHQSESHSCRFFAFPSKEKKKSEYDRWKRLLRRDDREPSKYSRVCSCHFKDGDKAYGPEIFKRNEGKLFPSTEPPPKKKKIIRVKDKGEIVDIQKLKESLECGSSEDQQVLNESTASEIILEEEVKQLKMEISQHEEKSKYLREKYSVSTLSDEVIRMETGLPTKDVFDVVYLYALRFKDSIIYFYGWKVESINLQDQLFICLMKLRQNYTNLHIAQLFACSETTISNIVITFIHLLHDILFTFLMSSVPSREKNKACSPSSFAQFTSCKIVIDCTDIEVATPGLMSQQSATYSSYRGMNSFKVLVGVAPNGVITYVSKLYPGSTSDKAIVEMSGFLNHLCPGDLVLADKGFLIQDIVPRGVSVNIPPFLNNGKFTENEIKVTKSIAKCRIHVERANARLKDFKILNFIPSYLRCYSEKIFQLVAALVNLQFPLIKEGCADEKVPVHSTNIPYHLEKMLSTLKHEEEEASGGSTGPCLEYLLQHKILDTLHTLGRADCPPGMKQEVLLFFANLLAKMKQPLLPHVNVYRPVHRLIRLCGEVRAAPSENEEVHFLCTVCSKLRQDPYLVNFFLEFTSINACSCIACQQTHNKDSSTHDHNSCTTSPVSTSSSLPQSLEKKDSAAGHDSSTSQDSRRRDKPDYTLVNSLLNMTKSEDSRIAVKACEGLLLCASLPEDHAATVIILYTRFCEIMADRLNPLFQALPQTMDPADIANASAKWGLDHIDNDEDISTFPGKRQLISFLSWFDYIDQLAKNSHKLVAKALAVSVRERFLQPAVEPRFMQQSEQGIITTTAIIRRCLRSTTSNHMLTEFSIFLLGENTSPETESLPEDAHKLRQKLIERCDHISDELSIETLKLFETLLLKPAQVILDNLVLRNLTSRKYSSTPPSLVNGDATNDTPPSPKTPISPPLTPDGSTSPSLVTGAGDAEREEVVKNVNSFLSLVPDQVKSSALTGDTGYDTYLRDAHEQFRERAFQCCQFRWPSSVLPANEKDKRESFYEGAFLNMLFKKLQRLLDQTYDMNLQVTCVMALLAQFNHPHINEYLLNPHLSLTEGCRSLYTTLENVVKDLSGRIERIPNFQKNVVTIRKQLMGVETTAPENNSMAHNNLLEACIVLEEFCKELAAIAFVKATSSLHPQ